MERHAALLRKRRAVEKRILEGKEKVEKAKARVVEEEGRLAGVEVEMAEVVERIRVLIEEDEKREKARREEAERAREARCMEVEESEEEEEEVEEEEEKLEGGKRRKVVRKGRFSRAGGLEGLDVNESIRVLKGLSRENKALCLRSLGGSGSCSDASGSKRDEDLVSAQVKVVTVWCARFGWHELMRVYAWCYHA